MYKTHDREFYTYFYLIKFCFNFKLTESFYSGQSFIQQKI